MAFHFCDKNYFFGNMFKHVISFSVIYFIVFYLSHFENRIIQVLEKMRPIDQKLKYQIDKLIKTAATGGPGLFCF